MKKVIKKEPKKGAVICIPYYITLIYFKKKVEPLLRPPQGFHICLHINYPLLSFTFLHNIFFLIFIYCRVEGVEGEQTNILDFENDFKIFFFLFFFFITDLKSTLHPPPSTPSTQTIYNFKKHINY